MLNWVAGRLTVSKRSSALTLLVILLSILALRVPTFGQAEQASLTLERIDGVHTSGDGPKLLSNTRITFYFKMAWSSATDCAIQGVSNAFRVYSPDGAFWSPLVADTVEGSGLDQYLDLFILIDEWSNNGQGADTVGFAGASFNSPGFPNSYSDIVYKISTIVPEDAVGKTICLDSSYAPPSFFWLWAGSNDLCDSIVPSWNGSVCFEIISGCCTGIRGNVNNDPNNIVNISDVTYLSSYLFGDPVGPAPVCVKEANVNGDPFETVNISDFTYLVKFLFGIPAGPEPPGCVN